MSEDDEREYDNAEDEFDAVVAAEPWNVYFLSLVDPGNPGRDFERIKVGFTRTDVEKRIAQLQTGNPYQIRCEDSFPSRVASQVERWVHRTNAAKRVYLEWLRLTRDEVPGLVEAARRESERLSNIAEAKARWSETVSNGKERLPGVEEERLHAVVRDVQGKWCRVHFRLRETRTKIALTAGNVARIPGIMRLIVVPAVLRFNSRAAVEKFRDLAARHAIETIRGKFRWRNVPTRGSREWGNLRETVDSLERQQRDLDRAILARATMLGDVGERTDVLARLHEKYLDLNQDEARLRVDEAEIRAEMIERLEDYSAVTGVCSFGRSPRLVMNAKNAAFFREAHPIEANECKSERAAFIRRTIYASRSY